MDEFLVIENLVVTCRARPAGTLRMENRWFLSMILPDGYGSIPINTIFSGLFTSINPSYFDVNYRGTIGFAPSPDQNLH